MVSCWNDAPGKRPGFGMIMETLELYKKEFTMKEVVLLKDIQIEAAELVNAKKLEDMDDLDSMINRMRIGLESH